MGERRAHKTVGVFCDGAPWSDFLFEQCDDAGGFHKHLRLRPLDSEADVLLFFGNIPEEMGGFKARGLKRKMLKSQGRLDADALERTVEGFERSYGRTKDDLVMLVYEPSDAYSDAWFETANRLFGTVMAPDDRAGTKIVLPTMWTDPDSVRVFEAMEPNTDRLIELACITSGKSLWAGHTERLDFLKLLGKSGVSMDLFGRGLGAELGVDHRLGGAVRVKSSVLRASKMTLAIENTADNDRYVTEKLWDPLLNWSLPLYFGSKACDPMIPSEAFIRIPDLGEAGVACVRETLATEGLWESRLDAIREARQRILGEHRLVELLARTIPV